jgi:V/A-type H+-transporting ATPase subunit E
MEGKVSQLAEKLLKEGVEQGEVEKKRIVDAAQTEAKAIIEEAEKKAAQLIEDAEKRAKDLVKNGEAELKLSGDQALSAIKQRLVNLVVAESVEKSAAESLADPKVMTKYIETALSNWKGDAATVELLLPEAKRSELEAALSTAVKSMLNGKVSMSFSKSVKGGFQIAPEGSSYKITLSDEDFANFFKAYLRPRVRTILFGE